MSDSIDYSSLRKKKRYSHASIRVRMKIDDQWKSIRALDWNDRGFNFFIDEEINDVSISLKKDNKQFEGSIVWCFMKDDKRDFLDAILNTLVFKRLEELKGRVEKDALKNALSAVRTYDNIEEKKGLLKSMGINLADKSLAMMLEGFSEQHSLYKYGVHVDDEHWKNTVNSILKDTKDMMDMDAAGEKIFGLMAKLTPK